MADICQRRKISLWTAGFHLGADMDIHHPTWNRDNNSRRPLNFQELTSGTMLDPSHDDLLAKIRMPTVVDFPLFADMGRMNG